MTNINISKNSIYYFIGFISFLIILFFVLLYFKDNTIDNTKQENNKIDITTGDKNVYIDTGTNLSGDILSSGEIPLDTRGYLDYILNYGQDSIDYTIKIPIDQPNMNSKIGSDNTIKMHDYINKNQIKINLPETNKKGYIMFVTDKKVSNNKNIFIGIDGKTIGRLDKNNLPIETYNDNEYLYELENLLLIGNSGYKFSKDLSEKNTLYIGAVVGESNNKVEKIIIFFK